MDSLEEYFSTCREVSSDSDEDTWCPSVPEGEDHSVKVSSEHTSCSRTHASSRPLELQHVFVGQKRPAGVESNELDPLLYLPGSVYAGASSLTNRACPSRQLVYSQLSSGFPILSFLTEACINPRIHQESRNWPGFWRAGGLPSYIPEDEAVLQHLHSIRERQDAILFDALCTLRQVENQSFVFTPVRKERKIGKRNHSPMLPSEDASNINAGYSTGPIPSRRWRLRRKVWKELHSLGLENFSLALRPVLRVASDIGELKMRNDAFQTIYSAARQAKHLNRICLYSLGDDVELHCLGSEGRNEALGNAGCATLLRFSSFIDDLLQEFSLWVTQILELHSSLRERRRTAPLHTSLGWVLDEILAPFISYKKLRQEEGESNRVTRKDEEELGQWARCFPFPRVNTAAVDKDGVNDFSPSSSSPSMGVSSRRSAGLEDLTALQCYRLDVSTLITTVQENALPLQRWLIVLQESQCFDCFSLMSLQQLVVDGQEEGSREDILSGSSSSLRRIIARMSPSQFGLICAKQSASLLDFLIVRSSELQSTSTFGLYRCYMMLVMYLSWPYFDLSTAAMYGFVHMGDVDVWRQLLPRMFRVSFSHLRVSGTEEENPTDVLSLILNCVEYYQKNSAWNQCPGDLAKPPAYVQPLEFSSLSREHSSLVAARQRILHSCAGFCRQRGKHHVEKLRFSEGKTTDGFELLPEEEYFCDDYDSCGALPLAFAMPNSKPALRANECIKKLKERVLAKVIPEEQTIVKDWVAPCLWCLQLNQIRGSSNILVHRCPLPPKKSTYANGCHWSAPIMPEAVGDQEAKIPKLWINTEIPCTRWITAALLIPFGRTVQQLQKRRLNDLYVGIIESSHLFSFSLPLSELPMMREDISTTAQSSFQQHKKRCEDTHVAFSEFVSSRTEKGKEQVELQGVQNWNGLSLWNSPSPCHSAISLSNALRLIIDIALFGNYERIVNGFVRQLYLKSLEGPWWKGSQKGGVKDNTIAGNTLVSALFSEAIRGLPFAELVQLVVTLPKQKAAIPSLCTSSMESHFSSALMNDMEEVLDVFACFELRFFFPAQLALVLFPNKLSFYIDHAHGQLKRSYGSFFWQKRRGAVDQQSHPACSSASASRMKDEKASSRCGSVPFGDLWSTMFGYLVAVHYAQMCLQEQRKSLQRSDVQVHELQRSLPYASSDLKIQGHMVSRGFGGAFYALAFILDTLIRFTMQEILVVVYELEKFFLQQSTFHSGPSLCERLDQLLLQLHLICFSSLPPLCTSKEESSSLSLPGESIRTCIADILSLALDPTRFPFRLLGTKTKEKVERLINIISSSASHSPLLHMRLIPLLHLLTFNQYYGDRSEGYRFR